MEDNLMPSSLLRSFTFCLRRLYLDRPFLNRLTLRRGKDAKTKILNPLLRGQTTMHTLPLRNLQSHRKLLIQTDQSSRRLCQALNPL